MKDCTFGSNTAFVREQRDVSDLGYESAVRVYRCADCSGCPHAARCLRKGSKRRSIYVNPTRDAYRKRASELLETEEGAELRRRRSTDVETVFGDVKRNWGFKRFTLRGLEKVGHEWRLLMMGHNIRKLARAASELTNMGPKPMTAGA